MLWQRPVRVRVLVVTVVAAGGLLSTIALVRDRITADDLFRFAVLALLSVCYTEASRRLEVRRGLFAGEDPSQFNMSSVWVLAAALCVPDGLAALIAMLVFLHLWARSWRSMLSVRTYRVGYAAAAMAITCVVVSAVGRVIDMSGIQLVTWIVVAVLTFRVVILALVILATATGLGLRAVPAVVGSVADNALELMTLTLGAATAVLMVRVPPLVVLVLPAVFLLHHRALLVQLVEAATVDAKTELLNAAAWRRMAHRELERAAREGTATAVLVIDMDHFKQLNDTYGHLAGDAALKAVAATLADELRGYDAVGRFGGEEFVALLPGASTTTAVTVAERVRRRIELLGVIVNEHTGGGTCIAITASIGVASARGAAELDDLLRDADAALYLAKDAGRNLVCWAPVVDADAAQQAARPADDRPLAEWDVAELA